MAAPYPPFESPDGRTYTFDHMQPISSVMSVTVQGKRYRVPTVVIFSPHCYTDGKRSTVRMDSPLYFMTDHTGHRDFCPRRYQTSLALPERMRTLIEQGGSSCYKLDKGNYIHIHDATTTQKWRGWYVLFTFDRSKAGSPVALRLSVTSYHYRQSKPENLRWTGSLKLPALVAEWFKHREDFLQNFSADDGDTENDKQQK